MIKGHTEKKRHRRSKDGRTTVVTGAVTKSTNVAPLLIKRFRYKL